MDMIIMYCNMMIEQKLILIFLKMDTEFILAIE